MIRSFFAIDLPGAFRDEIGRLQARLKQSGADVKWVRTESVHLTLKFLGDVAEETLPSLAEAVGREVEASSPLRLVMQGTGVFPNPARARVVWLGLTGDLEALAALQHGVEKAAAGFGFEPEGRAFKPHLTLGRVRSGRNRSGLLAELDRLKPEPLEFMAEEVVLFKSDLRPTGAVYTPLQRLPLGSKKTEEQS